jgi:hypothetical protein
MYRLLIFVVLFSLLAGCARPTPPPLPPEEILARVVVKMKSLAGFRFVVVRSGAPAYLDPGQTLSFSRMEGDYVSPDRAQGQVRVIAPGFVASVRFISIAERYWETNYLTGEWWECPPDQCFNPAILFDAQVGLQTILESDLSDLKRLDNEVLEELPGRSLYSVAGRLAGERLYQMSWGMIGPEAAQTRLWVDPETFVVHRIQLEEPAPEGGESTLWTVDFLNFDEAADIQPPPTATPKP